MNKKTVCFLVVVLVLFMGCAGPEKKTTIAEQETFPEARYLTAEGSGTTEHEARRRALAELSAIFESRVQSETTSLARAATGTGTDEQFEKTVESRIAVATSVQLRASKIGRVWIDTHGHQSAWYALAVIDRQKAGRIWSDELETVDARVTAQVKVLESTRGRFQRMVILNRIFTGVLRKQAIEGRLRVLNYPARSQVDVDITSVAEELAQLHAQLRFFADLSGDGGQVATARIADALTAQGLLFTHTRNVADVIIGGRIDTLPLELNNPRAQFIRATATVQVVEAETDATVASLNENVRKGHVDQAEAARRAVLELSDTLADRLVEALGLNTRSQTRGD